MDLEYHPRVSVLPGGIRVATVSMPQMTSVSVGLWVGVGSRLETEAQCGASHFIEHMLFKGTRRRSAREISQAIEGLGGYLNAFTGEENTCFYAKARSDAFPEVWDVLGDMFVGSRFAAEDVIKEREVIREELAMYLDQPQHLVHEVLNEVLWPDHPLGRSLTGTQASLGRLTRDALLDYRRCHYIAPRIVVSAAGRIRHREIVEVLRPWLTKFPDGKPVAWPEVKEVQDRPRVRLISKKTEQTQVALGIRLCSRHDERRFALRLLNTVLGENMSSRLFQVVREDRGLAYSIYSSPSFFDDVGVLSISAGLDAGNLTKVLRLVQLELARLKVELVSRRELGRAKDYVMGQIDLGLENTEHQMMWVGEQLLGYGRLSTAKEVKERLARVTPQAVRSVARAFLRSEGMSLAVVSPLKRSPGWERFLEV